MARVSRVSHKKPERLKNNCHLDKELFEYSEQIGNAADSKVQWQEELYLLSSDDSLVLIHPRESAQANHPRESGAA